MPGVTAKMKALVTTGRGNFELKDFDIPKPGPNEMLVKVVAVAQNPTDWKSVKFFPTEGNIVGCDFAGIIEELGPDSPVDLKVGDRVASWVHGSAYPNGAFAEYVVGISSLAVRLPDSWTFEEAAQLGIAGFTSCMCLYYAQSLPTPLAPAATPTDILVWGGSSSVGQYVVQLASQAGLCVLATCSPRNFELVRTLGAHEVLDYNDESTPAKIRELTGNRLRHAVDCVSEGNTGEKIAESIGDEGGDVSIILTYDAKRADVKNKFVLGYQIFGKALVAPIKLPADPEKYDFGVKAAKLLSELLAAGKLKPGPVKLLPKGLESVKEGFEYMQSGKVSGEKLTYRIRDTPGL